MNRTGNNWSKASIAMLLGVLSSIVSAQRSNRVSSAEVSHKTSSSRFALDRDADFKPAQRNVGERLALETRFAQFFFAHSHGDVNAELKKGDPALDSLKIAGRSVLGPFAGQTVNCRSCHYVDELAAAPAGGNRTYSDFAKRSPMPTRANLPRHTVRNSIAFVNSFIHMHSDGLLHSDGEFASVHSLVAATLTGPNYGWLPGERDKAMAHIAHVVRDDDGTGELAKAYGGSYHTVLLGMSSSLRAGLKLAQGYRIDTSKASDRQIFDEVVRLLEAYVTGLEFSRAYDGSYDGSPYDVFLRMNHLPLGPQRGESARQYVVRLHDGVERLEHPRFVSAGMFSFRHHHQAFVFGPLELQGLRIFLSTSRGDDQPISSSHSSRHQGNCATCHVPPDFSDFRFHNTGVSQVEYDSVHGRGAFAKLFIPGAGERDRMAAFYLPATALHPGRKELMRAAPSEDDPRKVDLGVWNIFLNGDYPEPQEKLRSIFCGTNPCSAETALPQAIARFKTPSLRDLADSNPYMHNGSVADMADVPDYYIRISNLARAGLVRNADPELAHIFIDESDVRALTAFLNSLTEDYETEVPLWKR